MPESHSEVARRWFLSRSDWQGFWFRGFYLAVVLVEHILRARENAHTSASRRVLLPGQCRLALHCWWPSDSGPAPTTPHLTSPHLSHLTRPSPPTRTPPPHCHKRLHSPPGLPYITHQSKSLKARGESDSCACVCCPKPNRPQLVLTCASFVAPVGVWTLAPFVSSTCKRSCLSRRWET